jgi:D-amino-acid oxidase
MPAYLRYLAQRLAAAGGEIEIVRLSSLDDWSGRASIIVNCAGFGARELVPDPEVVPIRGQLVVVDNPGIERFLAEETGSSPDLAYVLPQGDHAVLGGSAERWRTDRTPDLRIAKGILARCIALEPRLRGARVREHRVGLRPGRPRVRFEHVQSSGFHLIHNYGHGGAGVTLSWGCANEVLSLVEEIVGHVDRCASMTSCA